MKNFGYTLMEILIALGIVGVVSAMLIPQLSKNTKASTIGPKLAKSVNVFENVNQKLLFDSGVNSIARINDYPNILTNYMKIQSTNRYTITSYTGGSYTENAQAGSDASAALNGVWFLSADGMVFSINTNAINTNAGRVHIDINGASGPNRVGRDVFIFSLWNDGTLHPKGAHNWDGTNNDLWSTNNRCTSSGVTDATYCAGSIFENDLKVIYP